MAASVYKHLVPNGTTEPSASACAEPKSPSDAPFTEPSPSDAPFTEPSPSDAPFTEPSPSAVPFTEPSPSAVPFTEPSPSAVPFTEPSPSDAPFGSARREARNVYSTRNLIDTRPVRGAMFALVVCMFASAILASWLPLQVSIVTVFLFAGPHNWFEFRYFLMRLPAHFGKSRNFFLTAFIGLAVLTVTYISLPFLYQTAGWTNETWLMVLASWNSLMLFWLALLIRLREKQKRATDWSWTLPLALALAALNWRAPELFSLALVYAHPLIALWFLDRHLKRTRPEWLGAYRRCLCLLPVILGVMIWQLSQTSALGDDNGLFWRITQHSGAQLLPRVSSHLLVSVHLFLEMLHYGVWILALPLLGPKFWDFKPASRGVHRLTPLLLVLSVVAVAILWLGFAANYTETRDLYFTIAIAHVLAEAPFLLKML